MSSLTTAPVADVLAHLFREAAKERDGARTVRTGDGGRDRPGPRAHRPGEGSEREHFARARHRYMAVSPRTGTLLYMLARLRGARAVVEFGTSFGISILHLAAAVKDNGGGVVIGTEYEQTKVDATRRSVVAAGLADVVDLRAGDASETLARDLPDAVDLLFLDGGKQMYRQILELVEPRLAAASVVVADNAGRAPDYLDHVRSCGRYLSADVGGDVEVSLLSTP